MEMIPRVEPIDPTSAAHNNGRPHQHYKPSTKKGGEEEVEKPDVEKKIKQANEAKKQGDNLDILA